MHELESCTEEPTGGVNNSDKKAVVICQGI